MDFFNPSYPQKIHPQPNYAQDPQIQTIIPPHHRFVELRRVHKNTLDRIQICDRDLSTRSGGVLDQAAERNRIA
ncbi:hypothetical protein DCAR_0312120 [Daucus carota subsp. sativus]|uniref:Uncharacterized protein n=1 Tax=Daucus carota subsp. sativus TaxID=79200 RepID=A0A169WC61_DAUCS|nr:hypothetical protein DCAR_0312120 [Daucus carota subsp. sativus]